MKKIQELIKPIFLVVFGVIMLLIYLGGLGNDDAKFLVLAIFGVVFAAYYISVGLLNVTMGEKMNATLKMFLDILNVSLFAFLMLYQTIVNMILWVDLDMMNTTGWIVNIYSIAAALGLIVFMVLVKTATKQSFLDRLLPLFAVLFALALLLNLVFSPAGVPVPVGELVMVEVALYAMFLPVMFNAIGKPQGSEEPKQIEE